MLYDFIDFFYIKQLQHTIFSVIVLLTKQFHSFFFLLEEGRLCVSVILGKRRTVHGPKIQIVRFEISQLRVISFAYGVITRYGQSYVIS